MHPLGQDTTYFIIHCTLLVPGRERKALSSHKVAFATRYATKDGITEFCPEITLSFLSSQGELFASKMCVGRTYRLQAYRFQQEALKLMIFEVIYWAICVVIFG